jgi:outer membrane protein assembly factor BamB
LGVAAVSLLGQPVVVPQPGGMAAKPARSQTRSTVPAPTEQWRYGEPGWGTPDVFGETMYSMTRGGDVVALDVRTGKRRWQRKVSPAPTAPQGSRVVVSSGIVVVGEYSLAGLSADSGVEQWRFEPSDGYGPGIYLGAVRDGRIYAGSPAGRLYGVDLMSGRQLWSTPVVSAKPVTVFAPIVAGGLAIAGFTVFGDRSSGGVIGVDARSGEIRWRRDFPRETNAGGNSAWAGGPVAHGELVFVASSDGSVYALTRRDGVLRSTVVRGEGTQQDFHAMAIAGNQLVVGSLNGDVTAYGLPDYEARWTFNADLGSVGFGVAVDDNAVYVPYINGRLVAVSLKTGAERWRTTRAQGVFPWTPRTHGNQLFLSSAEALVALFQ